MDALLGALRLAQEGARSNLWGLGCPFYCQSSSAGALLAAGLLGLILGVFLGAIATVKIFSLFQRLPEPTPPAAEPLRPQGLHRRARLVRYLDG